MKQKQTHRHREQTGQEGGGGGEMSGSLGQQMQSSVWRNEALLYSTGKHSQRPVKNQSL